MQASNPSPGPRAPYASVGWNLASAAEATQSGGPILQAAKDCSVLLPWGAEHRSQVSFGLNCVSPSPTIHMLKLPSVGVCGGGALRR